MCFPKPKSQSAIQLVFEQNIYVSKNFVSCVLNTFIQPEILQLFEIQRIWYFSHTEAEVLHLRFSSFSIEKQVFVTYNFVSNDFLNMKLKIPLSSLKFYNYSKFSGYVIFPALKPKYSICNSARFRTEKQVEWVSLFSNQKNIGTSFCPL